MKIHRTISRKDKVQAVFVIAAMLLVITCGGWLLQRWQERYNSQSISLDEKQNRKTLEYQGKTYAIRDGVETYLFMGIDVEGPAQAQMGYMNGRQADVQLLVVIDRLNRTWQLLQINRDSMVEVPVLGVDGEEVGMEVQQIALAHTYGDGLDRSCENNVAAVSRLLNGQKINGYMALNMDAVSVLTDMVGGVQVTVLDDFTHVDDSLKQGRQVTLSGEQAMAYVRGRQGVGDETNLSRMVRQVQYMDGLYQRLRELSPEDYLEIFGTVEQYVVTDGSDDWLTLAQLMREYTRLEPLTIAGESGLDEQGTVAYWLDEDSRWQTIIQLFYQRVTQE